MAVLSGERPDRVPIFECLVHDGILEHFGGRPIEVGDFAAMVRACAGCLDLCHPVLVPRKPGHLENADGSRKVVERWTTWTVPAGPPGPDRLPAALGEETEAAEAWQPSETAALVFRHRAATVDEYAGGMVYIHLASWCSILPFGLESGIYAYADRPEDVRRWNRAVNGRRLRELDALADGDVCPVCIIWNDIAFKNGLLYSPWILEELFYPHLAAQIELLHSRAVKVVFHSDGDVTEALPRLAECGIDAFNPLEVSAGMDASAFRDLCGPGVALVGGIDAVDVLARGTPDLAAEKTRELIDLFREEGNLMIASASGQVDNSMPTENVLAMYETAWSYGVY